MTEQDSLLYDTVSGRPLPGWLVRQKQGLNTYTPEKMVMKEDKSLQISAIVTGLVIILIVILLTVYFFKKTKKEHRVTRKSTK